MCLYPVHSKIYKATDDISVFKHLTAYIMSIRNEDAEYVMTKKFPFVIQFPFVIHEVSDVNGYKCFIEYKTPYRKCPILNREIIPKTYAYNFNDYIGVKNEISNGYIHSFRADTFDSEYESLGYMKKFKFSELPIHKNELESMLFRYTKIPLGEENIEIINGKTVCIYKYHTNIICPGYIPKGTEYWEGKDFDYASKKLILL